MAFENLSPLPFMPVIGKFDLNTYVPGSSDYEIIARMLETYNSAVAQFNEIISKYIDIDAAFEELKEDVNKELKNFEEQINQQQASFESNITNQQTQFENRMNTQIQTLQQTVDECQEEVQKLINGEYIDNYVKALAQWIDNNLQVLVSQVVQYVWFEITEDGYFVAYIPDKWDFIDFDTELNPDNEDYGKLRLDWEPEVVQ